MIKRALIAILLALALPAQAQQASVIGPTGVTSFLKAGNTRDLTLATGNVAYTGFGFKPSTCFVEGNVATSSTQYTTIIGMSDSARTGRALGLITGLFASSNFVLASDPTAANFQVADIASYDTDGLTLSWTKTGSPTGTFTFNILCYR